MTHKVLQGEETTLRLDRLLSHSEMTRSSISHSLINIKIASMTLTVVYKLVGKIDSNII